MASSSPATSENLEAHLERLQEIERFEPPEEFKREALLTDPSIYEEAARDPVAWWEKQAEQLHWFERWEQALDDSNPPFFRWFVGGEINASYNCLDRHVQAGLGDRVAFHWRGEEGEEREVTYAQLHRDVQRFANALKARDVRAGDVVGIFLPMIPELVVAMLACARIGAVHNVVFGGFAVGSVRERMEISGAKALVTVDGTRRKGEQTPVKPEVDEEFAELQSVQTIFVVRHTGGQCEMREGRDIWYHDALEQADPECPAEPLDAEHPLFILYSSGSTAKPKGIVHTTGGYLTGLAWTHKYVFDLKADSDVYWCSADVGWVTGHSYIVYGPMLNGATSIMFEGAPDYPHRGIWWELVERYKATIFYTAPTAIRTLMKWGPEEVEKYDLSSLRLLGTVGEPINPKAWLWYHTVIGGERCPIVDTWWQTETGQIMISPLPGITATKPGSAGPPLPAIEATILDQDGNEVEDEQGYLVLKRPWPGMLRTLFEDDERYIETYFSRFGRDTYLVGDAARRDDDGYFWIIGRTDDVVNVSGHRLSTAEVESAIVAHGSVAEAAVIGQSDEDTGQAICAYITLEGEATGDGDLETEIREFVARRIGKLARPKRIIWTAELPKTRSGKIMRRLLRDIAEGREVGDVTTLGDADVVHELAAKTQAQEDRG
jgi:acetyl-CoA synthetase